MNILSSQKREQLIALLVEGNSLRGTARIADVAYNTVLKFVPTIGAACAAYQDKILRNVKCKRIQVDEIWSFVYAHNRNLPIDKLSEGGDVWTWTAIDADTKLVLTWLVGQRTSKYAELFMKDLRSRVPNRVQLTSDGLTAYIEAVESNFGADVDYARTVKTVDPKTQIPSTTKDVVIGQPNPDFISTSYVERQNLNIRMSSRRFTRKTNAFSKKIANHEYALALHFMHHNFARIHSTLRITPAMAAGISDHVWDMNEILDLVDSV